MTATSDDGRALLAAIAAQPEDDTVRLAMADWLDEHGQHPRAEFIRVQVELDSHRVPCSGSANRRVATNCSDPGCEACRLRDRESELLAAHGDEWLRVPCPECGGSGRRADAGARMSWSRCPTCNCTGDAGGLYELIRWPSALTVARRPVVYERGFPHAVEVSRLEDVLEQPICTNCNGTGRNPNGVGNTCFYCSDTGLAPEWEPTPWARAVVTHHPTVREFRVKDREPYPNGVGAGAWYDDSRSSPSALVPDSAQVPSAVIASMNGEMPNGAGNRWKAYRTREAALTALWRALAEVVRRGA